MGTVRKWKCTGEPPHSFDAPTDDGFCPIHPPYEAILIEYAGPEPPSVSITLPVEGQQFTAGSPIPISAIASDDDLISKIEFFVDDKKIGEDDTSPYSFTYPNAVVGTHVLTAKGWDKKGATYLSRNSVKITVNPGPPSVEVGLCVLLMDASSSMIDPAFEGSHVNRMRLVASSAAAGIFDLERMQNNPHAFVAAFKFDDRVENMFVDTVANLINRFDKDVKKFANYIYEELYQFQQGTDINQALTHAHTFVEKFLKNQLPDFPLKNYTPMKQRILKYNSTESVSIPNIRVLLYTDGRQYVANGSNVLHPNPFTEHTLPELNHDVVIGAFFGSENDEGCNEMKSLLTRCPIHDEPQFFLFDDPSKISNIKSLFRMASGASGFCPKCLEKKLYR